MEAVVCRLRGLPRAVLRGQSDELVSVADAATLVTSPASRVHTSVEAYSATQRGIYPANSRRKATEGSELYYACGIVRTTVKEPSSYAYWYYEAELGS